MTYGDKLRLLADFYDSNPSLPTPVSLPNTCNGDNATIMVKAAKLPNATKIYEKDYLFIRVPIKEELFVEYFVCRNVVCTPVEYKEIEIPALPAKTIREVTAWECHPLLDVEETKNTNEKV